MMLKQYRLDSNGSAYEFVDIIEDAFSVVWTERWQEYGDAQIVLPVGSDVRVDDIIEIPDRDMVAIVEGRRETETDITLRCRDALSILDRRIVYPTVSNDGLVSTFVSKLLTNDGIIRTPNPWTRTLKPLRVADNLDNVITGTANIQRSYGQVGETLIGIAKAYGFDPTCTLAGGLLTIGARTSATVRVWGFGSHVAGYTEDTDTSKHRNVVYVGGQVVGGTREIAMVLDEENMPANLERKETFVDRRDMTFSGMDSATAIETYGAESGTAGGMGLILEVGVDGPTIILTESVPHERATLQKYASVNQYMGTEKLTQAVALHPWTHVTFLQFGDNVTATISKNTDSVQFVFPASILDDCLYRVEPYSYRTQVLWGPGMDALADTAVVDLMSVTLEGLTPYADYDLGDTVKIYLPNNRSVEGHITEVIESWDDGGYQSTPTIDFSASE